MATAMQARGHENYVLSFDDWRPTKGAGHPAPDATRGFNSEQTHNSGLRILRVTGADIPDAGIEAAVKLVPDLIHVHHGMLWPAAERIVQQTGARSLVTAHVNQRAMNRARDIETTLASRAQESAFSLCDAIHAPAACTAAELRRDYPDHAERIFASPIGVHAPTTQGSVVPRDDALLAFAGRFDAIKGLDVVIDAALPILAEQPKLRLALAGGNPNNRKSHRRWVRRILSAADTLGVGPERIDDLGWLDDDELTAFYRRATLIMVPSRIETFGQVPVEAALCGCPAIVSGCDVFAETLGEAGVLAAVDVADIDAWKSSLRDALSDPTRRESVAGTAHIAAGRRLWRFAAAELELACERILAAPRSA